MNIIGLDEGVGPTGEPIMGLIVGKCYELSTPSQLAYRLTSPKDNPVILLPRSDNAHQKFTIQDISCSGHEIELIAFTEYPGDGSSLYIWVHHRFRWFSRAQLVKETMERKRFPWKINQHTTPLCGIACLAYYLAQDAPERYEEIVLELHQYGFSSYHGYEILANKALYDRNPILDSSYPKAMPYADWILMASLRKMESSLNYVGRNNQVFQGINWPWVVKKLVKRFLGFPIVEFKVFSIMKAYIRNYFDENRKLEILLNEIEKSYETGAKVMLLIDSDMLQGKENYEVKDFLQYHWIAYEGGLRLENADGNAETDLKRVSKVKFKCYTWGESILNSRTSNGISKRAFIRNYYAYLTMKSSKDHDTHFLQ